MTNIKARIAALEEQRKNAPTPHRPEYLKALNYWGANHARFDLIAPDDWSESEKAELYEIIETGKRVIELF